MPSIMVLTKEELIASLQNEVRIWPGAVTHAAFNLPSIILILGMSSC